MSLPNGLTWPIIATAIEGTMATVEEVLDRWSLGQTNYLGYHYGLDEEDVLYELADVGCVQCPECGFWRCRLHSGLVGHRVVG